ncbi:hypothetical protein GINT2_001536 [Glugoides intestinalis]
MATNTSKYHSEVFKRLEKFKTAQEWSDFIEPLNSLCTVFKKYSAGYIPWLPHLVKRLNQLLNPALPGGIHLKTIECYKVILDCISFENLIRDFDVLTVGLFNFSMSCKIIVANEYLDLLEKIISHLGSNVDGFVNHIILGVLPFLESESSEFYNRAYHILCSFLGKVPERTFYIALWNNFIEYPDMRISVLNFLNKQKSIGVPDYGLVTNAFCAGLASENQYIIRSILELSNRDFPYVVEFNEKVFSNKKNISSEVQQRLDALTINSVCTDINEKASSTIEITSAYAEQVIPQALKDIAGNMQSENDALIKKDVDALLEKCNKDLVRSVLRIFLKKEISIHKRAYKWLNIGETVVEKDIDYIEKGLRLYLSGREEDLSNFFKIVNSLADRENLVVFLMERVILDAVQIMMSLDEKKNVESFYIVKKNAKSFLNYSLDEFYRVIYTKLNRIFETFEIESETEEDSCTNIVLESEFSEDSTIQSNDLVLEKDLNTAEQLIRLVIYSVNTLNAFDQNVATIHIPLLCHLLIRNKRKIAHSLFSYFLGMFLEKCEGSLELESKEVSCMLINTFYQKENAKALLEINLVGAIAKELGRLELYVESGAEAMLWADADLVIHNGILMWTEMKNPERIRREKHKYFNFCADDIEIIYKFTRKHGYKDFPEEFLNTLGVYLAFNYKFVDMINMLEYYIDYNLLRVIMWNDFIVSKNPKYLLKFEESFLSDFLIKVLPVTSIQDVCIFLSESLKVNMYHEMLFRVITTASHHIPEVSKVLLNLHDSLPLLQHVFDRYYSELESEDPYRYDIAIAILNIIRYLIDNNIFLQVATDNSIVEIKKFGSIGIREVLVNVLFSILVKNLDAIESDLNDQYTECYKSAHFLYKESTSSQKVSRSASDVSLANRSYEINYEKYSPDKSLVNILDRSSSIKDYKKVSRLVVNILYQLARKSISITISDADALKRLIKQSKNDFYILKRTLLFVKDDISFIHANYMHFYRPILALISTMPLKESFFSYLASPKTSCTIEILLETWKYIIRIRSLNMEDFYRKALKMICERFEQTSAIYKKVKGYYRKIDNNSSAKQESAYANVEGDRKGPLVAAVFIFKEKLTGNEIAARIENNLSTGKLIVLQQGDISAALKLASLMFLANKTLFVSTLPWSNTLLYMFGTVEFKEELFKSLIRFPKNSGVPLPILSTITDILSISTKETIIKAEADYLRTTFGTGEMNVKVMWFLIQLFKDQQASSLSRTILANILHSIELSIEAHIKQTHNFDKEIKVLSKMVNLVKNETSLISYFKLCCFGLLNSKKYQKQGLEIIYSYFLRNPNCKVFIDAFVHYFSKVSIGSNVFIKKKVFTVIGRSNNFDPFIIINNLIANMESSFFMSLQNEEAAKINSLQRMSFLVLSQPMNKFSSLSDTFVTVINRIINSSTELKTETLRFCTVLMLKIENHYLQTLFPILVGDFISTVFSKDLKVVVEIFRFVDISIWLGSPIFTFKVLFLEKHCFFNQLKSHIFNESTDETQIKIQSHKLPNFLACMFSNITSWSQLSFYLKRAPEYYSYIASHMIERDFEETEKNLFMTFEEIK